MVATVAVGRISRQMGLSMVLVMVLLVLQRPLLASARFAVLQRPLLASARFTVLNSSTVSEKSTLETNAAAYEPVVIDLMQYHHKDSPYANPHLTVAQRMQIAVKSSNERAQWFQAQISKSNSFGKSYVFTSSVYSVQGSYVMQISIGTPVKNFVAIADTGSDLVWLQCYPCTCFPQPDSIFNSTASSSYSKIGCPNSVCSLLPSSCSSSKTCLYQYGYGDQSTTSGDLSYEKITMKTTTGTTQAFTNFAFGCGHNNQGTFQSTDGLVGLGQGPLSLVSQLGSFINNTFSYCLVSFYSSTNKTSALLLGSVGSTSLTWTPLLTNNVNPTFYYVNLTGITVNGVALVYPSGTFAINSNGTGGLILDSGTTITQMDTRAYGPFRNRLASLITYPPVSFYLGLDLCYDISGVSNRTYPSVVFQFQGLNVNLPPDNMFLQVNANTVCLAFQGSSFGFTIYGNIQQQNFQIAYDRANKRVGFAPKTC